MLRGGPFASEVLKKHFLDRFIPMEKREVKVAEFIKLIQVGMSVHEYTLKFSKLSKYALSLVSNHRYEMSNFVRGGVRCFTRGVLFGFAT